MRRVLGTSPGLVRQLVPLLLLAVTAAFLLGVFVRAERVFHFWDYGHFDAAAGDLAERLERRPAAALLGIGRSIRHADYNLLALLPPALAMLAAGSSRLVFVLFTGLLYALPATWLLGRVGSRLLERGWPVTATDPPGSSWLVAAALFPPVWIATARGFPDAAGLVAVGLLLEAAWPEGKPPRSFARAALGAVLLAVAFLIRRWYGAWAVGFVLVTGATALARLVRRRTPAARRTAALWATTAAGAALVVLVVATPMVRRVLATDYAVLYEAYGFGTTLGERWLEALRFHGLLVVAPALAGLVLAARRPATRESALVLLATGVVAGALHVRLQRLDLQHELLFAPMLIPGLALAAGLLERRLGRPGPRRLAAAAVPLLVGIPLAVQFSTLPRQPALDLALGTPRIRPLVRADYEAVAQLARDVRELAAGQAVYVACSSFVLNESILRRAFRDLSLDRPPRVLATAMTDGRDEPPRQLFEAGLVLACRPVQTHLRPEDQEILALTARPFLDGIGIARHFRRLDREWALGDDVRVLAFAPSEPVPDGEREAFLAGLPPRRGAPPI